MVGPIARSAGVPVQVLSQAPAPASSPAPALPYSQAPGSAGSLMSGPMGAMPASAGPMGAMPAAGMLGSGTAQSMPGLSSTGLSGTGMAPTSGATGTAGASDTSGSSGSPSADGMAVTGEDTFLQLLVAQLSNQDPTQPMDDQSFITELAQFNTVEQLLNLTQSVTAEVNAQQSNEGIAMIGKAITYTVPGIGGSSSTTSQGMVTGVSMANGQVQVQVNGQGVPLSAVTAVTTSG